MGSNCSTCGARCPHPPPDLPLEGGGMLFPSLAALPFASLFASLPCSLASACFASCLLRFLVRFASLFASLPCSLRFLVRFASLLASLHCLLRFACFAAFHSLLSPCSPCLRDSRLWSKIVSFKIVVQDLSLASRHPHTRALHAASSRS
jgi:hypothetical protein